MIQSENTISHPAYEYIAEESVAEALALKAMKQEESGRHIPIRYHNRNHTEEEQEELAIAGAFEETKNVKDLSQLLRDGKMKEFYKVANKVLRIKRNHPVVTRVKRESDIGETEIFEDRQ
jgi:hypothetical protein